MLGMAEFEHRLHSARRDAKTQHVGGVVLSTRRAVRWKTPSRRFSTNAKCRA